MNNQLIDHFSLDAVANKFELYGDKYELLEKCIEHYEAVKKKRLEEQCPECKRQL